MMEPDQQLHSFVAAQPYPLVFATVSGAHLYGFPSADSDYDLRGVHVLPPAAVMGLDVRDETIERSSIVDGLELDLVTHDARKFFLLLLRKNGYVLEQLLSPLVVRTSAAHEELKGLAPSCITRYHAYHYLGFAETQWRLFEKESPRRAKPLLYVYRVLLTGIHLMRTGEVEANLVMLNEVFKLPYVPDLIARKLAGGEHSALDDADLEFHRGEYLRLRGVLEAAQSDSRLPEAPTARSGLNDLLLRLRVEFSR
jgi:predicted nucleotidyltransferase